MSDDRFGAAVLQHIADLLGLAVPIDRYAVSTETLRRSEQAGQQYEDAFRRTTDQEQVARLKGKLQALRNVGSASH